MTGLKIQDFKILLRIETQIRPNWTVKPQTLGESYRLEMSHDSGCTEQMNSFVMFKNKDVNRHYKTNFLRTLAYFFASLILLLEP